MKWPWTTRASLEAAQERLRWTEGELRRAEDRLTVEMALSAARLEAFQRQVVSLLAEVADGEAERKLLLDRIVQLSGQAPLYEKQIPSGNDSEKSKSEAAVEYSGPVPQARLTAEDLRNRFRVAVAEGKVGHVEPAGSGTVN